MEEPIKEVPYYSKFVEGLVSEIQKTAKETGNKDLTFEQGYSILYRSRQIQNEKTDELTPREKVRQINICWKQRRGY